MTADRAAVLVFQEEVAQLRREIEARRTPTPVSSAITDEATALALPPPPVKPTNEDCCHSGCTPCVFDIYADELAAWQRQVARIKQGLPPEDSEQNQPVDPNALPMLDLKEYRLFTMTAIQRSDHSALVRCAVPHNRLVNLTNSQHVILRGVDAESYFSRPYSPLSTAQDNYLQLLIKTNEGSRMDMYVNSLEIGHQLAMRGPLGEQVYHSNSVSKLLLIAGGAGIAPLISIMRTIVANERDETLIKLIFCINNIETGVGALIKPILDELGDFWNVSIQYILSQIQKPEVLARLRHPYIQGTHVNADILKQHIKKPVQSQSIIVCGSDNFSKTLQSILIDDLSIDPSAVYLFPFTNPPSTMTS